MLKNITRQNLNQERRTHLGHAEINPIYPVVGEQLIITKNDRDLGLYNGQFCKVIELGKEYPNFIETLVETEEHDDPVKLRLHKSTFELYHNPNAKDNYKAWDYRDTHQADFGYVVTCHKAQGSQWDSVLVFEENVFNWYKNDAQTQRARWLYTAITRAVNKVTIVAGKI